MDLQKLHGPIEAQLALLGFELVCLESVREGRDLMLRLYIDHLDQARGGITLDDCVAANDGLVAWLDVAFPSLREEVGLEISSPGLERPLVKPAHFRRFAGRLCRIQALAPQNGQRRFKGWIVEGREEAVVLEEDGVLKTVPYDNIQKARLAPFEESKAPKPKHAIPPADAAQTAGVETSAGEEA
jgi:ribosome maturation factor RimP